MLEWISWIDQMVDEERKKEEKKEKEGGKKRIRRAETRGGVSR